MELIGVLDYFSDKILYFSVCFLFF